MRRIATDRLGFTSLMGLAICGLVTIITVCLPATALAGKYEVTPILGYTFGGAFENTQTGEDLDLVEGQSYGVILGLKDPNKHGAFYEFYYSRQETQLKSGGEAFAGDTRFDVSVDYFHLGGTYGEGIPYVAAGVGVTHLSPERGDSSTNFSFSLGGGARLPLTERIGLRLEGRGFGTLFSNSGSIFCVNNQCAVQVKGDLMWQFNTFAGLAFNF